MLISSIRIANYVIILYHTPFPSMNCIDYNRFSLREDYSRVSTRFKLD